MLQADLDVTPRRPTGRRASLTRTLPMALGLLLAFGAGVGVDRTLGTDPSAGASSSLTDSAQFKTLQATWDLIHSEWAAPDQVDDTALLYGAAAGMVDALGDEGHSRFLDPEQAKQFQESTQGQFVGVGVEISVRTGIPVIVAPLDGSPAAAAGIRSGDTIVAVDGTTTDRKTIDEVSHLVRGDEGTPVTLTLLRRGQAPFDVTLTRRKLSVAPVSWRMLPGGVAQVRVAQFSSGTTEDLQAALTQARQQGASALILDLRDNPGGLVSEAIGVSSQFMDEGKTVFQEEDRGGAPKPVATVGHDGLWLDKPLVVLVNGGSASAAEIVGGALRDNGRAPLLGEKTFGTGTVLAPFAQPDGSVVLLGTALWLTADGQQIWKQGVVPDREVVQPLDETPSRPNDNRSPTFADWSSLNDTQLKAAYEDAVWKTLTPPVLGPAALSPAA